MPKFTREFLQKVSEKYESLNKNKIFDYSPIQEFLDAHPDFKFDDTFENNQDMIDYTALCYAVYKEKSGTYGKILMSMMDAGMSPDNQKNFAALLRDTDELKTTQEIDDGKVVEMQKQAEANDIEIEEEPAKNDKKLSINDIFDKQTMENIIDDLEENEGGFDTYKDENGKLPTVTEIIAGLSQEPQTQENAFDHRHDATTLLGLYATLQKRSQERSFVDVLKHPFKTFGEWLGKKKLESELKNRYGLNSKQLETLTNTANNNELPSDYQGVTENGELLSEIAKMKSNQPSLDESVDDDELDSSFDSKDLDSENGIDIDEEENLDYDKLSKDADLNSKTETTSEFHEEKEKQDLDKTISEN